MKNKANSTRERLRKIGLIAAVLTFFCCAITTAVAAQPLSKAVESYRKRLASVTELQLLKQKLLNKAGTIQIKSYPVCRVVFNTNTARSIPFPAIPSAFRVDSTQGLSIVSNADKWLATYRYESPVSELSKNLQTGSPIQVAQSVREDRRIAQLISRAAVYSANLFFVDLVDDERSMYKTIAFFKDGKLCFIDDQLVWYTDFETLVSKKYGAPPVYMEHVLLDQWRREAKQTIQAIGNAKKVWQKNVWAYAKAFPMDTAKIVALWVNELDEVAQLTENQRSLITEKIGETLKEGMSGTNVAAFLDSPLIGSLLMQSLTHEQYCRYVTDLHTKHRWLQSQASNRLFIYFKLAEHLTNEQMDEAYKAVLVGNE